jgi:FkbM family methyltransferase
MNFFNRLYYSIQAIQRTRSFAVNPLATVLFFLIPEPLLDLFQISCYFRWQGFKLMSRRADWGPVDSVLLHGEYDFVEPLLKDLSHPIVIDLGANIGTFAFFTYSLCPSAIVHSVEASATVYQVLQHNRQMNPNQSWQTYQAAIWSHSGEIRFQVNKQASTQGMVSKNGEEVVSTMTLMQLLGNIQGRIDLLKMDIEGAEEEVLCSSESLLTQVEQIVMQIHPQRINQERVLGVLHRSFDFVYRVPARQSPNPLIVATRRPLDSNLELLWMREKEAV